MDSKKRAVVVGALLHDIGKVGQRAQKKEELSKATIDRESDICPQDPNGKFFTHLHVLWTHEFFSRHFSDELRSLIISKVDFDSNPQNLASYHHKPASHLQKLIQIADRTSSGERQETERGEKDEYITKRLSSIFNKVALKEETKIPEPYFYNLNSLTIEKDSFPKKKDELDPPAGTQKIEKYREKYGVIWEGFIKDFKQLRNKTIESNLRFDLFLNALYHLLMKYTWCVPSYTQGDADISLFDHSRTTAAIASCLYDFYGEKEVLENIREPEFLIVEGDISGIQKFIYKLSQPSNVKGVGKILRGRSMFLTLLPIVAANFITKSLDQSFVNIFYAGGGNFQILLPNTKEAIEKLNKTADEIDNWLFEKFRGELGLVVGYVEADRKNLGKEYGDVLDRLKVEMENRKSKKLFNRLFIEDKFTRHQTNDLCKVCGSMDATVFEPETRTGICGLCNDHRDLGSTISKSSYLVLTDAGNNLKGEAKIDFGIIGKVLFLDESLKDTELKDVYAHWKINSTDDTILGFKLFGQAIPRASVNITKDKDKLSGEEDKGYEIGEMITFDDLAQLAEGDKKLGVLRMDVDYLGLIFSVGISKVEDDWKLSGLSISRAAMFSRMLDWFFTGYLNTLCKTLSDELRDKSTETDVKDLRSKVDCHYYIVYSGGDDLFIVAPWDEALELALRIRNDLKEFAGYNKDVDISGGLSLVKAKFPISRSGKVAEEVLDEAKSGKRKGRKKPFDGAMTEEEKNKEKEKGRRRLAAFGEVDKWKEIEESLEFGRVLEKALRGTNGKKLPHSFLNRVLEIRKIVKDFDKDDPRRLIHIPELVYSIIRNVDEGFNVNLNGENVRLKKKLWDELVEDNAGLGKYGFGIKYSLIKTRRR